MRVLLLDNDADALRLCSDMLTASGYTVYACSSCDHATRMAALVRPRVILFHGCDGDEGAAFNALLQQVPHIPVAHYSKAHAGYEVYNAPGRRVGYKRASSLYQSIDGAVRAAVINAFSVA